METLYRKAQREAEAERYAEYEALIPVDCNDEDLKKWSDSIQKAFIAGAEYATKTTAQLKAKTLEEIRDTVAKNRGYENWETLNGSDLYDSDIDEVAKMYAESKIAQLKSDKAELLEVLKKCWEVVPLDTYEGRRWFDEIDSLIQKHKQ